MSKIVFSGGTGQQILPQGEDVASNLASATQTLTNKTISFGSNTITGNLADFGIACTNDGIVGLNSAQTVTNKTIDADSNTLSNIEVDNLKAGVLDTDISSVSTSDDTLASAKAIKTYVDAQIITKDNTDEITEGSSNLYFTDARARAAISASGSLSYNSSTGALTYTQGDTDTVSEGSSNLYFTDARARAVSIENVSEDATPQLGGDLDVNGNKITSASNGNIDIEPHGTGNVLIGNLTFNADQTVGASQDNFVLTYDNTTGLINLEASSVTVGTEIDGGTY
jgi:hypothetical protein